MKNSTKTLAAFTVIALLAAGAAVAVTKTITLPPDGVQWKESTLPGYEKVKVNCVVCHSAEYAQYQPPNASRAYFDTTVKRMKAVFKAPIDDADMPAMIDYLVKTYGNEQPK